MRLQETRSVERPIDEVFGYTADFANIQEWDPGVISSVRVGDEPSGLGSKYELEVKFGNSVVPMVYEITEFEPESRVVLIGIGDSLKAVDVIEFSEHDGVTRIDYTADLEFFNFFRLVAPLLAPVMRRVGAKALDGLVGALEN